MLIAGHKGTLGIIFSIFLIGIFSGCVSEKSYSPPSYQTQPTQPAASGPSLEVEGYFYDNVKVTYTVRNRGGSGDAKVFIKFQCDGRNIPIFDEFYISAGSRETREVNHFATRNYGCSVYKVLAVIPK